MPCRIGSRSSSNQKQRVSYRIRSCSSLRPPTFLFTYRRFSGHSPSWPLTSILRSKTLTTSLYPCANFSNRGDGRFLDSLSHGAQESPISPRSTWSRTGQPGEPVPSPTPGHGFAVPEMRDSSRPPVRSLLASCVPRLASRAFSRVSGLLRPAADHGSIRGGPGRAPGGSGGPGLGDGGKVMGRRSTVDPGRSGGPPGTGFRSGEQRREAAWRVWWA